MKKIVIEVSDARARVWESYLRNRFGKRMGLNRMVELLIYAAVAVEAQKELDLLNMADAWKQNSDCE